MYVHIHIELTVDELVYMPIYITYFSRIIIYQLVGSTRRDVYDSIYGPEYSGTLVYICSGDIYVSWSLVEYMRAYVANCRAWCISVYTYPVCLCYSITFLLVGSRLAWVGVLLLVSFLFYSLAWGNELWSSSSAIWDYEARARQFGMKEWQLCSRCGHGENASAPDARWCSETCAAQQVECSACRACSNSLSRSSLAATSISSQQYGW